MTKMTEVVEKVTHKGHLPFLNTMKKTSRIVELNLNFESW
jgi:hypothetical protein